MDTELNSTHLALQREAKRIFREFETIQLARTDERSYPGYSEQLWTRLAELGWLGLDISNERGGSGGDFLDLCAFYEEMGRGLVTTPHLSTCVIAGGLLQSLSPTTHAAQLLRSICNGSTIIATDLAYRSPNRHSKAALNVRRTDDGAVLSGVRILVPYADRADWLLLTATESVGGGSPAPGNALYLVDRRASGLTLSPMETTSGLALYEVQLNDVVPHAEFSANEGASVDEVLDLVEEKARVAACHEVFGAADALLNMTVNYALQRHQFGQPIGRYQAVQYMCTDIAISLHLGRLLSRQAGWRISENLPSRRESTLAKAFASQAARSVTRQAHEVHAGAGFMMEHDLQLFTRRSRWWEWALGGYDEHLDALGSLL